MDDKEYWDRAEMNGETQDHDEKLNERQEDAKE